LKTRATNAFTHSQNQRRRAIAHTNLTLRVFSHCSIANDRFSSHCPFIGEDTIERSTANQPSVNQADRALALSIRSTQLLGAISVAFGLVMIVVYGYFNRYQRFRPYFIYFGLIVWFATGVVFIASGYLLQHKRRAGAMIGIAVSMFQTLCAAAILVAFCTLPPISPVPIVVCVAWLAALGQLMVHLQRAMRAIQNDAEIHRGFELNAPRAVIPIEEENK
jgi:hypothetical protein